MSKVIYNLCQQNPTRLLTMRTTSGHLILGVYYGRERASSAIDR